MSKPEILPNGSVVGLCGRCRVEHEVAVTAELADVPAHKQADIIKGAQEFAASTLSHHCWPVGTVCVWEELDESEPGHILNMGWQPDRGRVQPPEEFVVMTWKR